ncbi:hypothetical protein JXM83_00535 [Candidatus Woesearchaeota archaeon]|nr:hypothetical protein [Candidatus Woesearchaeota archaeon]
MISVGLVRTQNPGNVGAVCRVMKNFGLSKLYFITPECDVNSEVARRRSKHALDVLESSIVKDNFDFLDDFDFVVGTSAIVGTDYNILRSPVDVRDFLKFAKESNFDFEKLNVLLLFGSEGNGLVVEELKYCDYLITINSCSEYKTLNLSHAVGIVLYEFFCNISNVTLESDVELASKQDKKLLIDIFYKLAKKHFDEESKQEVQQKVLEKLVDKSLLTKRELFALLGFFKKL